MKKILLIIFFIVYGISTNAQNVTITPGGITPAPTGTYARISYDAILALPSPVNGDMAYDISYNCLRIYNGSKWLCLTSQSPSGLPNMGVFASVGGNTGYSKGKKITVDDSGYVYMMGSFTGEVNFGGITKISLGEDIFVAKYNSSGVLQWVQTASETGPSGSTIEGTGIAVDESGNVYITGYYKGDANFSDILLSSEYASEDIFLAKYNSSGAIQWVKSEGGPYNDQGQSIAVDASGFIYVAGLAGRSATFSGNLKPSYGDDIFVTKYNSSGNIQWINFSNTTNNQIEVNNIAIDGSGKLYITGNYRGGVTFGTTNLSSLGNTDIFVAKYLPITSTWAWAKTAGGTGYDKGVGITLDSYEDVYVIGTYEGEANFSGNSKTAVGSKDIFVAKYNNSGVIKWVQSAGGTDLDEGQGIAVDGSGSVYITGSFKGTANFGNTSFTSAGDNDIFVAKYNTSGNIQWVHSAGGTSWDIGGGIAIDSSGNVYFTGVYSGIATFGNTSLNSVGSSNFFIGMLDN